jgi:hypothetical protein
VRCSCLCAKRNRRGYTKAIYSITASLDAFAIYRCEARLLDYEATPAATRARVRPRARAHAPTHAYAHGTAGTRIAAQVREHEGAELARAARTIGDLKAQLELEREAVNGPALSGM